MDAFCTLRFDSQNENLVISLLDFGAHVDVEETPINRAIKTDNEKILKLLIKAATDVNAKMDYVPTPLYEAILRSKNFNILKVLVEAGANVNDFNDFGRTPLK